MNPKPRIGVQGAVRVSPHPNDYKLSSCCAVKSPLLALHWHCTRSFRSILRIILVTNSSLLHCTMAPVLSSPSRLATSVWVLAGAVVLVVLLSAHLGQAAAYYEKFGPYYQHDIVSRPNFTDLISVRGYTKTEGFGALSIFDDPLTVKPDINSETVGRVQGFQAVCSLDGANVLITQTLHLPGGTLSFIGQFSLNTPISKFHCIGGTGEFEGVVNGIYELEVHQFNEYTLDAILIATAYYHKPEKM